MDAVQDEAGTGTGAGDADQLRCSLNCKCGKEDGCAGIPKGKKRCGCRCKCRRDSKAYDVITEEGRIHIMLMIIEIMDMMKIVPYELGVGFGGRRGYDPKKMFAIIVLKTLVGETCRGVPANFFATKSDAHLELSPSITSMLSITTISVVPCPMDATMAPSR